jgi:hypothetical protein
MFPGAFASRNPRSVVMAGAGFFRSGPDGLIMSQFGWADPETMLARNVPSGLLGLVALVAGARRLSVTGRTLRPGYGCTLFSAGDFYVCFPDGASPLQRVYASELDGTPISGEAVDALPTPWYTVTGCAPGGLAIISTWSIPQ